MAENENPAETLAVIVQEDQKTIPKEEDQATGGEKAVLFQMKHLILLLTILSFVLSLPVLFSIIWLSYMRQCDCEDLLRLPRLQVAIVVGLVVVFLVSNLVVYLRARFPVPGLLLVMVPLILMLTMGLGLVGAYKMESRTITGSPIWLKVKVDSENYWSNIKSCIYATRTCEDLESRSYMLKTHDFTRSKLSSIESGCCRPPSSCDMEYVNATFWRKEDKVVDDSTLNNANCDLWKNEETILCYNCDACKEGFLKTLQGKWWKLGTFLVVMALLLISSHLLLFVATMWERYGG
ncbi:tetraspanin-15-like [Actinidia eriantha]|uniref:tetraspanin-15-like n=1 Tax=Actinidia eriantha TaxID=165200 RepID=UPI002587CF44|nr:tetraspanin-15-like [Actinidia eriantha]